MKDLKNGEVIHLGRGIHYLQEDHPETIGKAVAEWIADSASSEKRGVA